MRIEGPNLNSTRPPLRAAGPHHYAKKKNSGPGRMPVSLTRMTRMTVQGGRGEVACLQARGWRRSRSPLPGLSEVYMLPQ
jgi:hypothetical protein